MSWETLKAARPFTVKQDKCTFFILTVPFMCTDKRMTKKCRWFGTETKRWTGEISPL